MLGKIKDWIMFRSREGKVSAFYGLCRGDETVLDVGVSDESKPGNPARNYFLKTFRFSSSQYVGLGVDDMSGMPGIFNGKRFDSYDGSFFPYSSREFSCVFSNAVLEHVGNYDKKLLFVNEMLRVGEWVFFTTPNKFFPIETHTMIPFLHWFDTVFYAWCRRFKPMFNRENLSLLSYRDLKNIMDASNCENYVIYKNRVFGLVMTFSVVCNFGEKK